jgi:hypothetical protein
VNKSPQPSGLTPQQALTLLRFVKQHPEQAKALLQAEKRWREKKNALPNSEFSVKQTANRE